MIVNLPPPSYRSFPLCVSRLPFSSPLLLSLSGHLPRSPKPSLSHGSRHHSHCTNPPCHTPPPCPRPIFSSSACITDQINSSASYVVDRRLASIQFTGRLFPSIVVMIIRLEYRYRIPLWTNYQSNTRYKNIARDQLPAPSKAGS